MNGSSLIWTVPVTTNDFALLKLAREIDLTATPYVKAACWPSYAPVPGDNNVSTCVNVDAPLNLTRI